jgi:hypothetical protein
LVFVFAFVEEKVFEFVFELDFSYIFLSLGNYLLKNYSMEKLQILDGGYSYNNYKEIMQYSEEKQRMLFYGKQVYDCSYIIRKETDTHIYWKVVNKTPKFYNNKLFYKTENKSGITYDKKTKSIKIWFGLPYYRLSNIILDDVYSTFKKKWVLKCSTGIGSLINNTIFKRILKDKVLNEKDICRDYLKTCPYKHKEIDLDQFKNFASSLYTSPKTYSDYFLCAKDCSDLMKFLPNNTYNPVVDSLVNKALMLDEKLDFSLSQNEFDNLEIKWTKLVSDKNIILQFI